MVRGERARASEGDATTLSVDRLAGALALLLGVASTLPARADDGPASRPSRGVAERGTDGTDTGDEAPADAAPSAAGEEHGAATPALRIPDEAPEAVGYETVVRLRRPEPGGPGAAASVVDAGRFAGEAKSVAELLATAPGVAVREYGGLGKLATASIRGSSASGVKVFLDGMPLDTAAGGGVNLSTIPRGWIESVEVVRGADGAHFGAGALGGAVNVVTRPAAAGSWSARLHGGSFATVSAGADRAFGGSERGALLAVSYDETDGAFPYLYESVPDGPLEPHRRRNNASRGGGLLAKGHLHGVGGRFDALLLASGAANEIPSSDPRADAPASSAKIHSRQEDARLAAVLRHARPVSPELRLSTEFTTRHERLDLTDRLAQEYRQRDSAASAKAVMAADVAGHALEAGGVAGIERLDGTGFGGVRSAPELALFAADDFTLGPARFGPALRWDREAGFGGVSAKLGAAVRVAGPVSLRASAGRTFRAPSLSERFLRQATLVPNPELEPETGTGGDAALVAEGRLGLASAGGFAALYDDLIVYEAASVGTVKPFNMQRALVRGAEVEIATAPRGPARLSGQLSYTYQVATSERAPPDQVGRDVPHRPRHRLFARLAGERGRVGAHVEAHHVGAQWRTARNTERVDAATTFNAGGSLLLLRRGDVRLHADLRNLADDRTLHDGFGNPLPSRMVLIGLRASSTEG
jgi:outer membrane cobalamin receptor